VLTDDAKLIRDCLTGRQSAWDELIERYSRLVYSIPLRVGLSAADADDVAQIVWGIVLRRLETLRDVERLSAWLIRTTYREAWRRGRQTRKHATLDESLTVPEAPEDAEVERVESQHLVRRALEALDQRCRSLLTMLFLDKNERSYEEIADELGMKIGSIGPTRARCFKRMEQVLSRLGM
jgi:RNA polymerase sigma factor (sigma-70 family)